MKCPNCDTGKLIPSGTVVKPTVLHKYYECPKCGYILIIDIDKEEKA